MSADRKPAKVTRLPAPLFLLEVHSERMIDAMHALRDAGFTVEHVMNTNNRFRVEDAREHDQ